MTEQPSVVDYGEDVRLGPGDNLLATIDFLANELLEAQEAVTAAEGELQKAQERARDLAERQLPEAMDQARQKDLTTASNVKVKVEDKVRASIPAARKPQAFSWLREHGHGAIIKTALEVPFEAGLDEAAVGMRLLLLALSQREDLLEQLANWAAGRDGVSPEHGDALIASARWLLSLGPEAPQRFQLDSSVHTSTLAALVRELLKEGKIDQPSMEVLGAHAWKAASVKRKD